MKPPISYYGGKKSMLKDILPLVPSHDLYTEVFAGGAALLFAKKPVRVNVINDLNGELVNFYRTIVTDFDALRLEVLSTIHSREQHDVAWFIYRHPDYFDKIKRAWAIWTLSRLGFSGIFSNSFSFARTTGKNYPRVQTAKDRFLTELKDLLEQCTIEQDDAMKILVRYDIPTAFHFVDPPYVGSDMGHYSGMFSEEDLRHLLDILSRLKGKFMLTMYPNDLIQQSSEQYQ